MFKKYMFLLIVMAVYPCATTIAQTRPTAPAPLPAPSPSQCSITGEIQKVLKIRDADKGSLCHKYPCRAMVKIISVAQCGSGITRPLIAGQVVEVKFGFTLANTKKAIPKMQARFPGLKKGDRFSGNVEQHIGLMNSVENVVFMYNKL